MPQSKDSTRDDSQKLNSLYATFLSCCLALTICSDLIRGMLATESQFEELSFGTGCNQAPLNLSRVGWITNGTKLHDVLGVAGLHCKPHVGCLLSLPAGGEKV